MWRVLTPSAVSHLTLWPGQEEGAWACRRGSWRGWGAPKKKPLSRATAPLNGCSHVGTGRRQQPLTLGHGHPPQPWAAAD